MARRLDATGLQAGYNNKAVGGMRRGQIPEAAREARSDVGRCGEIQGDMGRCRELRACGWTRCSKSAPSVA
eukprot:scaffold33538_cov56-Phaeocystis_antarctica.AAC.1